MSGLAVPILVVYAWYWAFVLRRIGFFTADGIFATIQVLMAVGSLPLLVPGVPADDAYAPILAYTAISFMIVSALIHVILHSGRVHEHVEVRRLEIVRPTPGMFALLIFSIVIVVAYFAAVGYSALLSGFSGNADVSTLRLNSYAGSRYLFPGYVNQFKNSLFPALVVLSITYWSAHQIRHRMIAAFLVAFGVFGLIGTGQRGALIIFCLVTLVYMRMIDRRRFLGRASAVVAAGLPAMVITTMVLARGPQLGNDAGFLARIASALSQLQSRILGSNQESGVAGFRYTYGLPTQHGHEWLTSFAHILPGHDKVPALSNLIFQYLYGDDRGTSPPSLWGSIYYNFGYPGIVLAPILLAAICAYLTRKQQSARVHNSMQAIGIAGIVTVFGFWAAGDPTFLLNTGILAYGFLWWWGNRQSAAKSAFERNEPQPDFPSLGKGRTGNRRRATLAPPTSASRNA